MLKKKVFENLNLYYKKTHLNIKNCLDYFYIRKFVIFTLLKGMVIIRNKSLINIFYQVYTLDKVHTFTLLNIKLKIMNYFYKILRKV